MARGRRARLRVRPAQAPGVRHDLAGRRAGGGGIWQSLAGSFSVSAYATPASRWLICPADATVERDAGEAAAPGNQGTQGAQGARGTTGHQAPTGRTARGTDPAPPSGARPRPGTPAALTAQADRAALGALGALAGRKTASIPAQPRPDSASPAPAENTPDTPPRTVGIAPAGDVSPLRVGHSDVSKLREAAQDARRWDSKYGGGDWRSSMVPECLRVDAAPLLLGSYSDEVGRALFGAAAELTRLAGWMAFDTGQQEAAQRYYIQALRLARAAADVPLGGYVLASMSLQATYRGFADEGVDLAQAAVERNRGLATARTMSFFRLVEARAHAKANDAAAAGSALTAAESWLERSREGDGDPSWLGFYSYDRFAADAAECHLDLKAPRQVKRFTEQALSRPTEEFVRSHGLRLVVSAVAELESGNLDAACAAGTRAVEVAGRISSARTTEYVRDLLHRLEPYGHEPRVAELRERARPLLVAPA
ncbi:sporulation protein [Streptomyces sp. NPDC001274]